MKFLTDQNISQQTVIFLRKLGLYLDDVREVGLSGAGDEEIYEFAKRNKFVLITFDHDFSYKYIFEKSLEGLILLRVHPQTLEILHPILKDFFSKINFDELRKSIVAVERNRFRIRKVI